MILEQRNEEKPAQHRFYCSHIQYWGKYPTFSAGNLSFISNGSTHSTLNNLALKCIY